MFSSLVAATGTELIAAMTAVVGGFAGIIAVIAKKESYSVKLVTEALTETIKHQEDEIKDLREARKAQEVQITELRNALREERQETFRLRTILEKNGLV